MGLVAPDGNLYTFLYRIDSFVVDARQQNKHFKCPSVRGFLLLQLVHLLNGSAGAIKGRTVINRKATKLKNNFSYSSFFKNYDENGGGEEKKGGDYI